MSIAEGRDRKLQACYVDFQFLCCVDSQFFISSEEVELEQGRMPSVEDIVCILLQVWR